MFKKILIANRGEIACRVAASARRMGVRTVAVYSDADARAKHVQACDEAVHIGGSAPRTAICAGNASWRPPRPRAPRPSTPATAFSENEEFAQACADAGLVFIGPPPSAIRAMGLKAASKQLMERPACPWCPATTGPTRTRSCCSARPTASATRC